MLHKNRRHAATVINVASTLAHKLTEQTWTLCTAFILQDPHTCAHALMLANDALCEDAAAEYGVFVADDKGNWVQFESITVSWMTYDSLKTLLEEYLEELLYSRITWRESYGIDHYHASKLEAVHDPYVGVNKGAHYCHMCA